MIYVLRFLQMLTIESLRKLLVTCVLGYVVKYLFCETNHRNIA